MTGAPHPRLQAKVLTREEAAARFGRPRAGKVVFTNGCFDLLHRGHVELLTAARELGDALVVGLNSDESVTRLKGPSRPVIPEDDRALVLAALEAVDAVVLFPEDTPRELVQALLPDVLVKGGDYTPEQVVGREEVEGAGGKVKIFPLVAGRSTTGTLTRLDEGRE
ncbi:MAG: D-glycero-beta-D-manno-heptose 1-phosphate adenylyltransferase [Dehalococcoidia bacterium]